MSAGRVSRLCVVLRTNFKTNNFTDAHTDILCIDSRALEDTALDVAHAVAAGPALLSGVAIQTQMHAAGAGHELVADDHDLRERTRTPASLVAHRRSTRCKLESEDSDV